MYHNYLLVESSLQEHTLGISSLLCPWKFPKSCATVRINIFKFTIKHPSHCCLIHAVALTSRDADKPGNVAVKEGQLDVELKIAFHPVVQENLH